MPAVFDNRRADCAVKLSALLSGNSGGRGIKERTRIKRRAAKTITNRAVIFVCSRRRYDIHNHSRRVTELGGKTVCQQLNLADIYYRKSA